MVPYERARRVRGTHRRVRAPVLRLERDRRAVVHDARRPAGDSGSRTAGRVIPEMHVRLLDPTRRRRHRTGGPGIPRARARRCASATGTTPRRTRELFTADGWMRMGDLATIDADGYLTVAGRTSDFIIRGGKNISAAQVEDEVGSHPAVALCAAVAMPDATFGERVCVFVELRPGAALDLDALRAHLEDRGTGKDLARAPRRARRAPALVGGKIAKASCGSGLATLARVKDRAGALAERLPHARAC